ncbi:MAG TPA: hypothetical protein VMI73_01500 [Trebonia sp.]|nr:hypothetical protein [Trebonia sp.]
MPSSTCRSGGRAAGAPNAIAQGRLGSRLAMSASRASRYRPANTTSHRSTHSVSAKPPRASSSRTAMVVRR